jgi:hypothetical protein
MMAERGIEVDHSTVHRWVIELVPLFEKTFRKYRQPVGKSWRMDESVSRTQAKACGAVLKMEVGLPKPDCRSRLQTARCCEGKGTSRSTGEASREMPMMTELCRLFSSDSF